MRTTGPILAVGVITIGTDVLLRNEKPDLRVAVATGLAAGAFALLEKVSEPFAVGLAYVALGAVVLTRVDPSKPAPAELVADALGYSAKATTPTASRRQP